MTHTPHNPHHHLPGEDGPLSPCTPMRTLLSRLADGSLSSGPAHWVVTHHIEGCPGCAEAFAALRLLSHRLRALGHADISIGAASAAVAPDAHHNKGVPNTLALSPDRWDAVLRAWEAVDKEDDEHHAAPSSPNV